MADQEIEEFNELPEDHPALKALRATRTELKQEKAKAKMFEVQAKYPDLGLTADDFEGLTPDKFEGRAARLASLVGSKPAPEPPSPEPTPHEESPAEAAFRRMQQTTEGTPPTTGDKMISRDEAFVLSKRNPAEFERIKAAGLIKDWPKAEERGGVIVLHDGR